MSGFYPLSQEEADALNADGGHEPLTLEAYKPNCKRGDEGATYRLFWDQDVYAPNPPGLESEEGDQLLKERKYAVYNAEALWGWVKRHPKDPTNSFKISYESWCELCEEYKSADVDDPEPLDEQPDFVAELPRTGWIDFGPGTKWVKREHGTHWYGQRPWAGPSWIAFREDGEMCFRTFPRAEGDAQWKPSDGYFLRGREGEECIHKIVQRGWTDYYRGSYRQEVCYMSRTARGWTLRYDHDDEAAMHVRTGRSKREKPAYWSSVARGRLVSARSPDGNVQQFFTGPKGYERAVKWKVWTAYDGDSDVYFTGKKGKERVYRIDRLDVGDILHKRGPMHKEYIWKREILASKTIVFYEGGQNVEAIRRIVRESKHPSGSCETFCTGPKGDERAVRYGYPSLNEGIEVRVTERAQSAHWINQIYAAPRA